MRSGLGDVERDHNLTIKPGSRREHEGFDGVGVGRGPGGAHEHHRGPGDRRHCRGRAGEHEHRPRAGPGGAPSPGSLWDLLYLQLSERFYLQLFKRFWRRIFGSWRLGSIDYLDWVVVDQIVVVVAKGRQFEQLEPGHSRRSPLTAPGLLSRVEEAHDGFPGENHRLSREDHGLPWSLELWS